MESKTQLMPHDRLLVPFVWLVPAWIRPNHITVFRFVCTPVVIMLLILEHYTAGVISFFLVAFTDVLDGSTARLRNQVTEWGTFYDPIADKILVGSVLVLFGLKFLPLIYLIPLLALELLIMTGGYFRKRSGKFVTANLWGKWKMVFEVLGLSALMIFAVTAIPFWFTAALTLFIAAILFAAVSLVTYSL